MEVGGKDITKHADLEAKQRKISSSVNEKYKQI